MLAVGDYGVNNIGSVGNMLSRIDVRCAVARSPSELASASAIVLPGIGAFDTGVTRLKQTGLFDGIVERVQEKKVPILGICLGMQLLADGSEEGSLEGLGLVRGFARKLSAGDGLKVPHMGWNETESLDSSFFAGFEAERPRFYFVHSYHVVCADDSDVAARCTYGTAFTAALRRQHVFGTQFHPEKSHRFGKQLLTNFARLTGHA
jgi:glutamine amidotransferase